MRSRVLKTKFIPPVLKKNIFPRRKLTSQFHTREYSLSLVQAGPGFGKTTLLLDLCQTTDYPYYWYSLDMEDRDPYSFLLHLIHLFRKTHKQIGKEALDHLFGVAQDPKSWSRPLEILINELLDTLTEESLLILDDYHILGNEVNINKLLEHLVKYAPVNLHPIIASREIPPFRSLVDWRARGRLLEMGQEDLALAREEVALFFLHQYQRTLTPEEVDVIYQGSQGWIMALDMAWRGQKKGEEITQIMKKPWTSLPSLFDFLAREVLDHLSKDLQDFLIQTAVLNHLHENTCNYLRGAHDSGYYLNQVEKKGLLIRKPEGSKLCYHPLFKEFLEKRLKEDPPRYSASHQKMAHYFQDMGQGDRTLYHLLKAGDEVGAARFILENISSKNRVSFPILRKGLEKISPPVLLEFPHLLLFQGDLERYTSSYSKALIAYKKALSVFQERNNRKGMIEAYQKLALVYLDTVQPVEAEAYLLKGLSMQEEEERSGETHLLRLLAENKANQGDLAGARRLMEAQAKVKEDIQSVEQEVHLKSRLFLRTGRLKEAVELLGGMEEGRPLKEEREPRTHREGPMVLSLLYSFLGEGEKALLAARKGRKLAEALNSPFTEAVGYMRLGHAWQLFFRYEKAISLYQKGLEIMDSIGVARGRAEGLWGLTLASAHQGEGIKAQRYGEECCNISERSGDAWMAAQGRLALGINDYIIGEWQQALESFTKTLNFFKSCYDQYGQALSNLWLILLRHQQKETACRGDFQPFLQLIGENYHFLYNRVTLTGPRDLCQIYPPLLSIIPLMDTTEKNRIKSQLNLRRYDYHPGYTLHIKTLGFLRLFQGQKEVPEGEWKREKARELFKLLVTYGKNYLHRERIVDLLWPGENRETALRDFKVALNALHTVLEPQRPARTEPFFITRRGQAYGLNPKAAIVLDAHVFKEKIDQGSALKDADLLVEGLNLYQGEYLSFSLYYDWLREPREMLCRTFFYGSETLARLYLQQQEPRKALEVAERMLSFDNCWEVAYQLAIQAYLMMENGYLAREMYLTCARTLQEELAVEPLPATKFYLKKLFGSQGMERYLKELKKGHPAREEMMEEVD